MVQLHESREAAGKNQGKARTPLPFGQLSILLLLRFTESASTFVIFPFLNEVCSGLHLLVMSTHIRLTSC